MRSKKAKKPSLAGFIIKLIVTLLLVLILFLTGSMILQSIYENSSMKDITWQLDWLDKKFREQDYAYIQEELTLYGLNGEEYDTYWEICDGYADYQQYLQWTRTTEEMVEGSTERTEYYRQKVIDNAENCEFQRNQKQLNEWKADVVAAQK